MTRTPPHQRAWDDLLAVDQPRPVPDPTWAEQLRERVEQSAQLASACLPADATHMDGAAAKIERAAELVVPPRVEQQRLVPGPACGWCSRAPGCPAAAVAAATVRELV